MINHPQPKVIFFYIQDNASKIHCICDQVQQGSTKGKKILIHVPNEEAAKYVDALLWKMPDTSFLPHVISQKPIKEWIVITHLEQNLNQATLLFNLCPSVSPIFHQFEEIYEFYEESYPEKARAAEQKIEIYEANRITPIQVKLTQ